MKGENLPVSPAANTMLNRALQRAVYLHAKQSYLNYHIALTLGWPIAIGVIEAAAATWSRTASTSPAARWSLPGAEAVRLARRAGD
ncbi:hypothetical protein [Virgisporangium aurantiacum]|uniref:Uncharacterized protein n=1 Tax=Virgisporangium aurantiacum TaxID=175570 RepID=A0A8J4E4Q7_9ACTN|nr:hypothetical protein [Virgisporangium aurantiacum]GIJ62200.1 hypothetical protein Vau01_097160 [Virgisporangium aurantiacum]